MMRDRDAAFYSLTANCPEKIFHYTSPEAFQKIISSNKLRFTRFDCLNDYSEGTLVKQLFTICLHELMETNEIKTDFYERIKDLDISSKTLIEKEKFQFQAVDTDIYVCCFSKDQDALQMWQYYSKAGNYEGYNIGFNSSLLNRTKYGFIDIYDVEYDEDKQKKYIKQAIEICSQQYNKTNVLNTIVLQHKLSIMNICFKKHYFSGEREVRAILDVSRSPEAKGEARPKNEYRIGHGLMIPYFDLEFDPQSIEEITIGPVTSSKDNTMEKNREIIKQFASEILKRPFSNVKNSEIPIRY